MGILRPVKKVFSKLTNLKPIDRLKYGLEVLKFNGLKPDESKEASLFGYKIHYERFDSLSYLVREIFINLSYFCRIDNDAPVIFDIGGNTGISMLFFKKLYPDSTVYCFEPDPDIFAILERNVKENNLKDVFLINSGVSDYSGKASFYVPSWSSGSSSLFMKKLEIEKGFADRTSLGENTIEEKKVKVLRCSQFIEEKGIRHIDLLKIDAEGAEERIISDITPFLNRIDLLVMEFHYAKKFAENKLSFIIAILEKAEFVVSIEPLWMTNEPEVMATYLVKALNGRSKYIDKNPFW